MEREIIKIDEELCDGCGNCIPACHEGAIQIIDGKARLISDLFCDGLGACVGECPQNALTVELREAEPYDEQTVMETITAAGDNVIKAHLRHLYEHNQTQFLSEAIDYLNERNLTVPEFQKKEEPAACGCPGSRERSIEIKEEVDEEHGRRVSHLRQWPIPLHLISPYAEYYQNSDLLLAADCCGFAYPDFHKDQLKGKSIAIACPKLDSNQEIYEQKLTEMVSNSGLKSITVLIMQVPCCGGLARLAQRAVEAAGSDIPVNVKVIGINGEILQEGRLN